MFSFFFRTFGLAFFLFSFIACFCRGFYHDWCFGFLFCSPSWFMEGVSFCFFCLFVLTFTFVCNLGCLFPRITFSLKAICARFDFFLSLLLWE